MTFWNTVVSQYTLRSKFYIEYTDPSFFHKYYTEEIPSFPIKTTCSKYEKYRKTSYVHALPYIFHSTDTFHDFPLSISVSYINHKGRQRIINFSNKHRFICLYNHSDFFQNAYS